MAAHDAYLLEGCGKKPQRGTHPRADTIHSPRAPLRRDTRVFISAISRELSTVRQLVKKALEDSGYHMVEQATFPLDYRDMVDKLRHLLASCANLAMTSFLLVRS